MNRKYLVLIVIVLDVAIVLFVLSVILWHESTFEDDVVKMVENGTDKQEILTSIEEHYKAQISLYQSYQNESNGYIYVQVAQGQLTQKEADKQSAENNASYNKTIAVYKTKEMLAKQYVEGLISKEDFLRLSKSLST